MHGMDVAASHLGGIQTHKPMKEFNVRQLHEGYLVTKHDGNGSRTEHPASSIAEVHSHMDAHMGKKAEEKAEGGTGSAAEEKAEGE